MRLSSRAKGRLRRIAKQYAARSGKDWEDELSQLYVKAIARRRAR